jgi:hypothetical protein
MAEATKKLGMIESPEHEIHRNRRKANRNSRFIADTNDL